MEINEVKYGFKLLSKKFIEDINSTMYQYEHIKSKGTVIYLENDDTNNVFAIGFRTLPQDSTGVCHIIEHSLLCGSKKYPLKEPFVNLLKSSLATFLNAFTAYDWTMYPFASQTPKDFDNILSIYLDAVFNPLSVIDPKPFLQEGWHLELLNKEDMPSYKGVVYNEMKGAMSSVDQVLTQATLNAMYKDTFYKNNSGGDPDVIPELTYEAYKDFYHKHYTPQNAMTLLYGKMDIEAKLKFIDEEYFSNYDKTDDEIVIYPQEAHIDLSYETEYEISSEEDEKDNTYMSLCYGLSHYENYEEYLAMLVLRSALLSKNDSPLKKALLDAKLGQNVVASIDDDNIVPALHIYLQKTNPEKKEAFKKVFEDEVLKLVENGIDKELLLATINRMEFNEKEFDAGGMPKGILFAMTMMGSFNYRCDYESHLCFSKYYAKFKEELNNNYFENILRKYILESKHHVEVVVKPSKTLGAKKKALMDEKMKQIKESMTDEQIEALIKQTKELLAYQNKQDTLKELATLPQLKVKDIPSTVNYLESKNDKVNGIKAITHDIHTNSIAYLKMYFDISSISFEDLPYITLLKEVLLNVSTNKFELRKLNNIVKTYLGSLSFSHVTYPKNNNEYKSYVKLSASCLKENVKYIPLVVNEVLYHSKFTKKEVKQIIAQIINRLKKGIIENGTMVAINMASSVYDKTAALSTNTSYGPKVLQFFTNLLKDYDHVSVNRKLKEICLKLFNKPNCIISMSGDESCRVELKNAVKQIKLLRKSYDKVLDVKLSSKEDVALVIPSGVSYNSLVGSLEQIGEQYHGSAAVLAQIVNYDYLWNEIRVKGGAYGCSLSINRNNMVCFGSYRDPNVKNTYKVFKNIINYLENFKPTKQQFNSYVIGSMSGFDRPMSIPSFIEVADAYYFNNVSLKEKVRRKKEVLKTKYEDVIKYKDVFIKLLNNYSCYTIGNVDKIKEINFDKVESL